MRKTKNPKEHGGGFDFDFDDEEVKKILIEQIENGGEQIPHEEVDTEIYHNHTETTTIQIRRKKER